jgi:GT2 family glycosyltransferase
MSSARPTITAVVCTRHRPDDLARVLASLAWQTDRCDEVVVVDDASVERRDEVPSVVAASGLDVTMLRKDVPGLTASRNLAVQHATTDLVMFLDDDVVLRPDYVAVVRDAFASDPTLAGAGGSVDDEHVYEARWLRSALGVPGRATGRVHRSGWSAPLPRGRTATVEHLIGCNMTFRTEVLRRTPFDEAFLGYALGEDLDLSHRLHLSGHRLVALGDARLWHLTALPRHDRAWGYREVAIRPIVAGRRFNRLRFALAALTFAAVGAVRNPERARGNLAALRDVLGGRVATRGDLTAGAHGRAGTHTVDKPTGRRAA